MKFLSLLAILFLSCEKPTEPQPPALLGTWVGESVSFLINQDSNNSFSGNGTVGTTPVTIQGIRDHPDFSFTMSSATNTWIKEGNFVTDNQIRYHDPTDPPYLMNYQYLNRR